MTSQQPDHQRKIIKISKIGVMRHSSIVFYPVLYFLKF